MGRSEFAAAASRIGADIHATTGKLAKLTELAQTSTLLLFADPTEEINELAFIIKQDITGLNAKLEGLKHGTRPQRSGPQQRSKHSTSIVEQLGLQLGDAMRSFQGVLQTRSESVQLMKDRRMKIASPCASCGAARADTAAAPSAPPPPIFECASPLGAGSAAGAGAGSGAGSIFECASPLGRPGGGGLPQLSLDFGAADAGGEHVIDMPVLQQEQAQLVPSSYLQTRAVAVENVQTTLAELGSIFEQLAVMVSEQGQMLQRVDDDVEDAVANTTAGQAELQKLWRSMQTNRGLVVRVFAMLFFFVVLFATFF